MIYLFVLLLIAAFIVQHPKFKGYVGEGRVSYFLKSLDLDENYIVLHDILLPAKDGKTTQIDHLILSVYGIFVIETKNYKGWIFGDERKKYWTQVIYKKKAKFFSPLYQNYGHIKTLEQLIGCQPFISIIAFHPKATLKNIQVTQERMYVTYDRRILRIIEEYKKPVISHEELVRIENMILKNMMTDKHVKKEHIKTIRAELNKKASLVKEKICPTCGGKLVTRKGRYGSFLGCSNFPSCRFVEK